MDEPPAKRPCIERIERIELKVEVGPSDLVLPPPNENSKVLDLEFPGGQLPAIKGSSDKVHVTIVLPVRGQTLIVAYCFKISELPHYVDDDAEDDNIRIDTELSTAVFALVGRERILSHVESFDAPLRFVAVAAAPPRKQFGLKPMLDLLATCPRLSVEDFLKTHFSLAKDSDAKMPALFHAKRTLRPRMRTGAFWTTNSRFAERYLFRAISRNTTAVMLERRLEGNEIVIDVQGIFDVLNVIFGGSTPGHIIRNINNCIQLDAINSALRKELNAPIFIGLYFCGEPELIALEPTVASAARYYTKHVPGFEHRVLTEQDLL